MSDTKPQVPTFTPISDELVEKISGGLDLCSASEIGELLNQLKSDYDALVDFTSYVIDRVITSTTN